MGALGCSLVVNLARASAGERIACSGSHYLRTNGITTLVIILLMLYAEIDEFLHLKNYFIAVNSTSIFYALVLIGC